MGIPAPAGVGAAGTAPAGDQANAVVQGQITAIGPTPCFAIYGAFNFAIWAVTVATLTTVANSAAATVNSATGLAVGQPVNGANVPAGTTIGALSSTNVTLAFPAGVTAAQVVAGADAAAQFGQAAWAGTVQLERSFDGGKTFLVCGVGGAGQSAIYTGAVQNGNAVSVAASEPEKGVLYRLNCTAYTSGTPYYRISASGLSAMAWGVPGN